MGIVVALVAVTMSGLLIRAGRSDEGERALYFSVATKSTTGTYMGKFITIFGSGTFDGDSADANGIWSIEKTLPPSATNTVASGTWEATNAVSFTSFGVANPRGEGGQLVLTVTLHFDDGTVVNGETLTVTCRIGLTAPPPPAEGATLSGPVTFDLPVTGITTFGQPPD